MNLLGGGGSAGRKPLKSGMKELAVFREKVTEQHRQMGKGGKHHLGLDEPKKLRPPPARVREAESAWRGGRALGGGGPPTTSVSCRQSTFLSGSATGIFRDLQADQCLFWGPQYLRPCKRPGIWFLAVPSF